MTDSKEDSELMEEAYRDEAAWNSAVRETRKRDLVACGDLLRYGSVVKTWSKDPERDLREAIRIFDKESVPVEAAWCRVDLISFLEDDNWEKEALLDDAYKAFEVAGDRSGMTSVLEERGEADAYIIDGDDMSWEEKQKYMDQGYTIRTGYKKKKEFLEESDPTNGPALAMGAGAIIGMLSFIGLMSWEGGILNTIFLASITGCLTGLGVVVAGIYLMWKVTHQK